MRQLKITKKFTNCESASLAAYLHDISRESALSVEEEVELARQIKLGDAKALEKLTRANLRFVVSVAKQYQNQGLSLPDLINEGNIGLIKAAERFDETRGFKFISYAVWWIRQSIEQALVEQGRIVRIPANQVETMRKIKREVHRFEQENERTPSIDEIADNTEIPQGRIEEILHFDARKISADAPLSGIDNGTALIDTLPNQSASTDDEMVMQSLKDEIVNAMQILNDRERNVLEAFYGIGQHELTMEEIGKKLGLTRERVRQIRERAIRKLRNNTKNKALKSYLGR